MRANCRLVPYPAPKRPPSRLPTARIHRPSIITAACLPRAQSARRSPQAMLSPTRLLRRCCPRLKPIKWLPRLRSHHSRSRLITLTLIEPAHLPRAFDHSNQFGHDSRLSAEVDPFLEWQNRSTLLMRGHNAPIIRSTRFARVITHRRQTRRRYCSVLVVSSRVFRRTGTKPSLGLRLRLRHLRRRPYLIDADHVRFRLFGLVPLQLFGPES